MPLTYAKSINKKKEYEMKMKIFLIEQNEYGTETTVDEWTVVTDNICRALQMFEDELDERKMQRLEYTIL